MAAIQEWNSIQFKQTGQNVLKDIKFIYLILWNQNAVFGAKISFFVACQILIWRILQINIGFIIRKY